MTHCKKAVILLFLLLFLSACGSGELGRLEEENETLQKQVIALEEEKVTLQKQVTTIEEEKDGLQKQIDSLQTELELEQLRGEEISRENNPIDRFYDPLITNSGITYEMACAAAAHGDAWEAEARNLAEQMKTQLYFQEDWDLVDVYIATTEEQVQSIQEMAIFPASALEVHPDERMMYTGTITKVLMPESRCGVWKDVFFQLLAVQPGSLLPVDYTFIFDAEAARLELDEWLR